MASVGRRASSEGRSGGGKPRYARGRPRVAPARPRPRAPADRPRPLVLVSQWSWPTRPRDPQRQSQPRWSWAADPAPAASRPTRPRPLTAREPRAERTVVTMGARSRPLETNADPGSDPAPADSPALQPRWDSDVADGTGAWPTLAKVADRCRPQCSRVVVERRDECLPRARAVRTPAPTTRALAIKSVKSTRPWTTRQGGRWCSWRG